MSNFRARTGESITGSTRTHKKAGETKLIKFFTDAEMTGLLTPIPMAGMSGPAALVICPRTLRSESYDV